MLLAMCGFRFGVLGFGMLKLIEGFLEFGFRVQALEWIQGPGSRVRC